MPLSKYNQWSSLLQSSFYLQWATIVNSPAPLTLHSVYTVIIGTHPIRAITQCLFLFGLGSYSLAKAYATEPPVPHSLEFMQSITRPTSASVRLTLLSRCLEFVTGSPLYWTEHKSNPCFQQNDFGQPTSIPTSPCDLHAHSVRFGGITAPPSSEMKWGQIASSLDPLTLSPTLLLTASFSDWTRATTLWTILSLPAA